MATGEGFKLFIGQLSDELLEGDLAITHIRERVSLSAALEEGLRHPRKNALFQLVAVFAKRLALLDRDFLIDRDRTSGRPFRSIA